MSLTAVEILGNKYVLSRTEIKKISEKWWKRTARSATKWPKEGTFDVDLCGEMEVLIKNYKPNDKGKMALEKREREKIVLGMFKRDGEMFRLTERTVRVIVNGDKEVDRSKTKPPPYNTGLFPLVTGTVDIRGEVKIDERNKDLEAKKRTETPIHMDCYKQIRKAGRGVRKASSSEEEDTEGESNSEGSSKVASRKSLDEEDTEAGPSPPAIEVQEEFQLKRAMRKKDQKSGSGAYPILIRGDQAQYVPWGSLDLEGLILKLPNINDGASKWIRTFEEYTVGKLLAVGDIKALLARVLGISKMESLLEHGALYCWLDKAIDGTTFDTYRTTAWGVLRTEYPTNIDSKRLEGHKLGDTENPASFLQKENVRWRMETEKDPEMDSWISQMFRNAMLQALPPPVRYKLEDVVGLLTSHTHKQFSDQLIHAVDRHRFNEEKRDEQTREIRRRLDQSKLEEITQKGKDKRPQAVVTNSYTMAPVVQHAPQTANVPQPLPIVNVYTQGNGGQHHGKQQGQYRNQQGPPLLCWGCQEEGHIRSNCVKNPYHKPQGYQQQRQEDNGQWSAGPGMGKIY